MDIGPGDWVECVDPRVLAIRLGGIYCVRCVEPGGLPCEDCGGGDGLELVDVAENPEAMWCFCQFRPIYRPKGSVLRRLLTPVPVKETAR